MTDIVTALDDALHVLDKEIVALKGSRDEQHLVDSHNRLEELQYVILGRNVQDALDGVIGLLIEVNSDPTHFELTPEDYDIIDVLKDLYTIITGDTLESF